MFNRSYITVFSVFLIIFFIGQNFCSFAQSSDLTEAELRRGDLKEQMDELHEKGRYREAIAVGEEVLSVREKFSDPSIRKLPPSSTASVRCMNPREYMKKQNRSSSVPWRLMKKHWGRNTHLLPQP